VPFLRGVDSDKLEFLASMFRYVSLRKNDVLFKEGDLGLSMYIVLNGAVSPRVENEETSVRCHDSQTLKYSHNLIHLVFTGTSSGTGSG
jgi:CRP-like cAMP-binding protein